MGYWLKSYTDILDDPKYFGLSEQAQLAMHISFLVAKKLETNELTGLLPSLEEIAFHSRKDISFWQSTMPELITAGIITEEENGYLIKNYVKRQKAIPPEERVRQYRKRKNEELLDDNEPVTECNDIETIRNGEKRREEEEKSKRRVRDREDVEVDNKKNDNDPSLKKELLATFSKETGIPNNSCLKNEDKAALDRMVEVGVSSADLVGGIQFMREKKFPIVSIKSIASPAIIEFSKRTKTKIDKKDDYRQYTEGAYGKFIKN